MSNAEKERAALNEVMEYLSPKQRETVLAVREPDIRKLVRCIRFCCMVAGIRGYWPVRALTRVVLQKNFPGKFVLKD